LEEAALDINTKRFHLCVESFCININYELRILNYELVALRAM
jgi:hypothetical protein